MGSGPFHTVTLREPRAFRVEVGDVADMMLATGERIGETCAVAWEALDLDAGIVEIRGTVVRIKGRGLWIKPKPKSRAGSRKLQLPSWVVEMLRRRRMEARRTNGVWCSRHRPGCFGTRVTPRPTCGRSSPDWAIHG